MSINAAGGYGDVSSTSQGTKVTKDPEAKKPVPEASGVVTSDSLAAESQKQGGGFSATPSDQPSKGTTTNNTDTSGATELHSAKDKAERDDGERVDEKLGGDEGKGPTYAKGESATSGGDDSGVKESSEQKDKSSTSTSTSKDSTTSDSLSYASATAGKAPHQPKSQTQTQPSTTQTTADTTEETSNTTSGTQSSDNKDAKITGNEPNTSFTTTIGSKDDPALLAEQKIQASNARSGADAGLPNTASGKIEDESQYKVLEDTSA